MIVSSNKYAYHKLRRYKVMYNPNINLSCKMSIIRRCEYIEMFYLIEENAVEQI